MKKLIVILGIIGLCLISSCTENSKARVWGGTQTYQIRPEEKFVNATWKESNLWIITKDTITGDVYMREKSQFGQLEGAVIFKK